MSKNIAVILSGCGFLDGAEIRESVLTLLALDTEGVNYKIFAPNDKTHHVIDHLKGAETNETRNILVESARIARGKIEDIKDLNTSEFDAVVLPGGYGVAKNLCDFAFKGSAGSVREDVKSVISKFHEEGKAIGAICIAPALISLLLGDKSPTLTIGTDEATASEIEKTGAKHKNCQANEISVDEKLKVVTTPAYMFDDAKLHDIHKGISDLVKKVISL